MPVDLLMIRHGQSEWNAEGRWQGHADPPLTELGVEQARVAAASLGTVDVVATSDLERARVTGELIASALGLDGVEVDPRLRERDVGPYQGLTHDEIRAQYPGALDSGDHPEGWEPDASIVARVTPALLDIAEMIGDGGQALIVAHSGVAYAMEQADGTRHRGRLPNLGGVWLRVLDGRIVAGERIALLPADLSTTTANLQ